MDILQQPGPTDALIGALADSKVDLIAERDALRALAESRGDDAATYGDLFRKVLAHVYGLMRNLTQEKQTTARLRAEKPDAALVLRLQEENRILREYTLVLANQVFDLEGRAA